MTRQPTSPSANLAKEMRTDARQLQNMKASFFGDDDYDTHSIMSDATEGRDSPEQLVPTVLGQKSLASRLLIHNAKAVDDEPMAVAATDDFERTTANKPELVSPNIPKPIGPQSAPLLVRPRAMLFNISDMMLPMEDSILNAMNDKKSNTVPFFHGRSFKIGWSRGNQMTILGTKQSKTLFEGRAADDSSKSVVKVLQVKSMLSESTKSFKSSIVDHLKIQLQHDRRIPVEGSDCPRLEANGGSDALLEHHQLAHKMSKDVSNEHTHFNATVWSLMYALWGFLDNKDPQEHETVMTRRDLLSRWIETVVTNNNLLKSNVDYLDRLVNLMMCHKVNDACELALANDDINMSLLIAQSSGGPAIRQLIQHQLASWREVEADKFIDERRLRLLMMIGGVSAMDGPQQTLINIYDQLNWLKCLALQLWYISSPVASVTDAVHAYERNFQQDDFEVALPNPSYVGELERGDVKHQDIRFHLLKLFSQRSHPMETLLHPANYTSDLMDFRLSFLLLQTLDTLGYHHLSDSCRLKIYTSLAEQLETNGLWEWSVWVILHVAEKNPREVAIQQLLYRHVRIDGESDENDYTEKEKFIIEALMVPEKWLSYAKAIRAGSMGHHQVELKYLLKAEQWSRAHDVMMQHIAPELVINDQTEFLKSLLKQFEATRDIQNWKTQGEVLLRFIELNDRVSNCLDDSIERNLILFVISVHVIES